MSISEYTWLVDSANRDQACVASDKDNPTNDIVVNTRMSRNRLPVTSFSLCSIELPFSQYVIENAWSKIKFSEGLELNVQSIQDFDLRRFVVELAGVEYEVELPIYLNPIANVDDSDPNNPIFTTLFDHALDLRGAWNWGAPIELITTNLVDPQFTQLTATNPNLLILSDNQFQIMNIAATTWTNPSGTYGYLHAPTIGSPELLASILTFAFNQLAPSTLEIRYDVNQGKFVLRLINSSLQPAYVIVPATNSLTSIMGFATGFCRVQIPPECPYELVAPFGYQCRSEICLPEGNYNENSLVGQMQLEWNRFWFEPGCDADPNNQVQFIFSDSCGVCHMIAIPYGLFTPITLAEFLEASMNLAVPSANYQVTWDPSTGFTFQSLAGEFFGLEFADPNDTLHFRLGFESVCYNGQTAYSTPKPFVVPIRQCCGSNIPQKFLSFLYYPLALSSQKKLCLNICKPRALEGDVTELAPGNWQIDFGAFAHGFQVDDVIETQINGDRYLFVITQVVDPFIITVDSGSVTDLTPPFTACFQLSKLLSVNLFFSGRQPSLLDCIKPDILGFLMQDLLFPNDGPPFLSPGCFNLAQPKYLLLEVPEPRGATHTQHAWMEDNNPNILAKIILFPAIRVERLFPMRMILPQVSTVNRMRFRILNPDHSLYQLHGKEWSATICFVVPEAHVQTLCY